LSNSSAVRREGLLVGVRRIGPRLSLTLRFKGQDYVALLDEWIAPPTIDAVDAALVRMIGSSVQAVGEVEVSGEPDAPIREDKLGF
jgi:hypothetical protein